ncbi:hypothetical protein OOT00_02735 [Desulfobotulus sp. H1]|uniref:Type II secretion system protein GspE N-terminal domain-containing protein n=1 Tax=Desulfobotulus pelophilus TaxID=2823377 RepID=A0ABT3N626_9BACT|nr:hypothetical protein [Desulfobotulus pelophilus]MCW7752895.1 hypothetical protein [Desulfobotulus pelophilus]
MALHIGMTRIPLTTRFGELLIEKGLASPGQVHQALSRQKELRKQQQYIRIGSLLHKECGISQQSMEKIFQADLLQQILVRLRKLITQDPDLPPDLSCLLSTARFLNEAPDMLQGDAEFQILPEKQDQAFMLCLSFDFRFSDHSTTIDLPNAMDQIKQGLYKAMDIPLSDQQHMGIPIENLRTAQTEKTP